jgi:hypothetical protein
MMEAFKKVCTIIMSVGKSNFLIVYGINSWTHWSPAVFISSKSFSKAHAIAGIGKVSPF